MAEDIAPELLKKIQEEFRKNCGSNKDIQEISKKVADGTASCEDLENCAIAAGEMLAKAMHDNVSGDILPDGKMYYNIASRILPPNLEECHMMVADIAEGIYGILNEKAGIHIKALRPDLNKDRIDGLVDYVSNADQYEDVRKSMEQSVVNFSQSVATDAVHKNADFQYKAGLTPKIRRRAESGCCKWCQALEGTYDYADVRDTGNDVWRRHRDCRCEVTYDPGTGRTQNTHSKTWSWKEENEKKVEERVRAEEEYNSKTVNFGSAFRRTLKIGAADIGSGNPVKFDENAEYRVLIEKYSDELNNALSQSARKVAKYGSRDRYEYAAIVDLTTGKEVDFGTSEMYDSVNSYYRFLRSHLDGHYAMLHNHNIESGFSLADIQELEMWENLDAVIAITNNGISYTVVSNGLQTNELLSMEFEDIGKNIENYIEREKLQVVAAVEKYAEGGIIIYDGRSGRNN